MSTISAVSGTSDAWANMKAQRSQMQAKMFAKVDTDSSGGVDKTELQSMLDDVAKKTGVASTTTAADAFGKLDTNGDGSLSKDELGKGMKDILPPPSTMDFAKVRSDTTSQSGDGDGDSDDLFGKVDTDGDGAISKSELQSLMEKMKSGGRTDTASSATDSSTSSTSATSASDDMFAKLDTDGNGSLSQTEFEAGRAQKDGASQGSKATQHADGGPPPPHGGGGAGGPSSATSTTYDPLDTNEDGTVSAQERMAGNTSTDAVQTLLKAIDTDGDKKISASESDTFIKQLSSQLEGTQSVQNTSSSNTNTQSTPNNIDLAELVKQAYEQIASGLAQQTKGTTLSAVA